MSIADKLIVIIGKLKASTFKLDCHICSFGIRKSLNCLRSIAIREVIVGVIITFDKIVCLLNICKLNKGQYKLFI